MNKILKHPSANLPIAASLAIIAMELWIIFVVGPSPVPPTDEGSAAHLFQAWIVFEVLAIFFFFIKWVPKAPKHAPMVLFLQIIAAVAAAAPVYILGW